MLMKCLRQVLKEAEYSEPGASYFQLLDRGRLCVENAAVSISVSSFSHFISYQQLILFEEVVKTLYDLENRFTPRLVIPEVSSLIYQIRGERLLKDTNWSWKFFHSEFGLASCIKINCATNTENWYVKSAITYLRDSEIIFKSYVRV
ncbi:hypothetical protein C5167_025125 [Papaver somniferum]|uniref:Uncharacterized protein n=1 Tax=Papaver somniferum TaxID=3469 RepID=A0A4Y7JQG4_PAPSO|nr:hypothetical protein C5167_025125 [Papaver somniferum]